VAGEPAVSGDQDGPGGGPASGRPGGARSCDEHPGLAAELRALVLAALDRWEPAVVRLRDETGPSAPGAAACVGCPVCALLATLRGERGELAPRLAEQLAGLLAVLRAALEEGDPAGRPEPAPEPAPAAPQRRVQRIPIERVAP
jgi:hypothetical protein